MGRSFVLSAEISGDWRHDLKNQLGIVLGFAELLLDELPPDDARRAELAEIRTAATRAMAIINEQREVDRR
jgi:signal transduction histidine kinase